MRMRQTTEPVWKFCKSMSGLPVLQARQLHVWYRLCIYLDQWMGFIVRKVSHLFTVLYASIVWSNERWCVFVALGLRFLWQQVLASFSTDHRSCKDLWNLSCNSPFTFKCEMYFKLLDKTGVPLHTSHGEVIPNRKGGDHLALALWVFQPPCVSAHDGGGGGVGWQHQTIVQPGVWPGGISYHPHPPGWDGRVSLVLSSTRTPKTGGSIRPKCWPRAVKPRTSQLHFLLQRGERRYQGRFSVVCVLESRGGQTLHMLIPKQSCASTSAGNFVSYSLSLTW